MVLLRWLLVVLAPGLARVSAQESPNWTAEEAGMAALLREMARAPEAALAPELARVVERQTSQLPPLASMLGTHESRDLVALGGYWLQLRNAASGAAGEGFALYAWPSAETAGMRTFVVGASGNVLTTDGMRAVYFGTQAPEWNAAVATRSPETLAWLLTARGKGRDDQLWLPVARSRTITANLRVRGIDKGMERDTMVLVGPATWFHNVPAIPVGELELPAGIVTLTAGGTATLTGIRAPDLQVAVQVGRMFVPDVQLTRSGDGFELSFDPERLIALRYAANESAAVATLRNIRSAQSQCQASSAIDADKDGAGEFGYFAELSGKVPLRPGTTAKMSPPVLSAAFGNVKGGRVVRSGYVFQMFLPGKDQSWLAEADQGGAGTTSPDPQNAEAHFRCYAWPVQYGRSGKRTFVVDERGDVRACDGGGRFDGESKAVSPDAAYGDHQATWGVVR